MKTINYNNYFINIYRLLLQQLSLKYDRNKEIQTSGPKPIKLIVVYYK